MTPKDKKRLAMDIDKKIHQDLKQLAVQYNISVTKLILQLVVEKITHQKIIDGE